MNDRGPQDEQRPERHGDGKHPNRSRGLFIWAILLLVVLYLITFANSKNARIEEITLSQFLQKLETGEFQKIVIRDGSIRTLPLQNDDKHKQYEAAISDQMIPILMQQMDALNKANRDAGKELVLEYDYKPENTLLMNFLSSIALWVLLFALLWFFVIRQLRSPGGPGGGVLSFGRSRARRWDATKHTNITFDDVAGMHEGKEEVQEIIEFLKNPTKFQKLGGRIPKGILLVGAPGTGKTLLAKAIAGEANVPFFNISGSDFVEMFVGVGASRVRDLFRQAKENSPCIIFLDEIDAVGRQRGITGQGGGQDEREQTLNAMLVEMDGFETDVGVIVIGATNRPDVLDKALLRPGRFDRQIVIDLPDINGREEILKVHARKLKLAANVDLRLLARGTPNCSGADLASILNEAALNAVIKNKAAVDMDDLMYARDKVLWGKEKPSRVTDDKEELWNTAVHESGHALVTKMTPEVEPLHKVTIIPRGMSLGATMSLPRKDAHTKQKKSLLGEITVLYAGRIAEEMFCGDVSTGASHDIQTATDLAQRMVSQWGMSDKIGPINYSNRESHLFLGGTYGKTTQHSETTALRIDDEIRRIIERCYMRAEEILHAHRNEVERLAKALLEYEVLDADDVDDILAGRALGMKKQKTKSANKKIPVRSPNRDAQQKQTDVPPDLPPEAGLAGAGGVA